MPELGRPYMNKVESVQSCVWVWVVDKGQWSLLTSNQL